MNRDSILISTLEKHFKIITKIKMKGVKLKSISIILTKKNKHLRSKKETKIMTKTKTSKKVRM